nr:MAG TPA: hypothetical protein [Bacteriophage sp.]
MICYRICFYSISDAKRLNYVSLMKTTCPVYLPTIPN